MTRLLCLILAISLLLVGCFNSHVTAKAFSWKLDPREEKYAEKAEQLNPGWTVVDISYYWASEVYEEMFLLKVSDGMLQIRHIIADASDPDGTSWIYTDDSPIPLTGFGAEKATELLQEFNLLTTH